MNIAVLLTCYNRKDKTCSCLENLYLALDSYNIRNFTNPISLHVFLVDDGCTDGTSNAVITKFHEKMIHVIKGSGSLFWAGGMRLAWSTAIKFNSNWDFYLLLNDDTDVFPNSLALLMQTHDYCMKNYNKSGIYSGATCAKSNHELCTYGGSIWVSKLTGMSKLLSPSGLPQMCDIANANILLVPSDVVNKIGILNKEYQHDLADYDYSIRARNNNIPVLLSSEFCGACDRDHVESEVEANKICKMTLSQRKQYFNHPLHSSKDYLRYIYNTVPMRYPIVFMGRMFNLYFPRLYYKLHKFR